MQATDFVTWFYFHNGMEWTQNLTAFWQWEKHPPLPEKNSRKRCVFVSWKRLKLKKKNLEKIISCLLSNLKQECFSVYWYLIFTFLEHFNNITLWTHPAVLFSCSILTYMLVPSFQLYLLLSIYIRCCVSRLCTIYAVMNFFLSPKRRLDIEINILQTDRL